MGFINSIEAMTKYNVCAATLTKYVATGQLKREGVRRQFTYDEEDLKKLFSPGNKPKPKPKPKQQPQPKPKPKPNCGVDGESESERVIVVGKNVSISYSEALRIIKQEEAIKKQRENLMKDGRLLDKDEVLAVYAKILQSLFSKISSMLDVFCVETGIKPLAQQNLERKFSKIFVAVWDECGTTFNGVKTDGDDS